MHFQKEGQCLQNYHYKSVNTVCSRLQVRLGYITRKRAVEAVMQQESESRLRREQAEVVAQLQPLQKPFLPEVVARVEDWAKQ